MSIMSKITIDGAEYDIDTFSQEAKSQLESIQFVDSELARLQATTAALQTARNAYLMGLKNSLPSFTGDTIKLS